WKSRIKRYIDTKPNHDLIHYCLENPPYQLDWTNIEVIVSEGSPITTTARIRETYKNVSQDIRDQLNVEAEVIQIILTGIDNDIYSTVDAYPNAYEMWKAIERLKQGKSINVQDLKTNLYWEFGKFTSQDGESLESYYSSNNMQTQTFNTLHNAIMEASSKDRPSMLAPGWKDKPILDSKGSPTTTTEKSTVDACLNVCEIWKAIERLKQGESTNVQDLKTNLYWEFGKFTSQDGESLESYYSRNRGKAIVNSPQPIYDQEPSMADEDDETSKDKEIDKLMALISLSFKKIYKPTNNNLRTLSNTSRANQDNSPRINRSAGYENQRNGNAAGVRETVGSSMVQKSGIQYYNCKEFRHVAKECQKSKRAKDAPYHREKMLLHQELEAHYMYMAQLQQVSPDAADSGPIFDDEPLQKVSNDDHYNVFAMENVHPEQSEYVIDTYPIEQDAQNMSIDSLDMSYDRKKIDQNDDDNDLAKEPPESDEVIRLEKESRSKLSDLIRPYDYTKLNNLYDLFVPQREKLSKQRCLERSRISHINVQNEKKKESFQKRTTLLEKRMDESIPVNKNCQSSLEIVNIKMNINTIIIGVELCKQKIANRTYIGYIDPFIQNKIEQNFCPVISRINAGLDLFLKCLNEEMVVDLRYFNSLELEVDSLTSQLETQRTQFVNEIDRLLKEYYYADHMNAILGVYTELDEVTNLQCDYLELLQKCECLETKLSKSKMMSKSFKSVQKHAINLELELQQCKEKVKNDMLFKVNKTQDFCKEREQYFEIQT
nr:hypothetical protein [Tanacetum cinerariifolium]